MLSGCKKPLHVIDGGVYVGTPYWLGKHLGSFYGVATIGSDLMENGHGLP